MTTADSLWEALRKVDKELSKTLSKAEPTFTDIQNALTKYRKACQDVLLFDFRYAVSKGIEDRLWEAHVKINSRFRKLLANFHGDVALKKPVEKRKLEKRYLDFVKSSMRFYRDYIVQLSHSFGRVPALAEIGRNLHLELSPSQELNNEVSESLGRMIVKSCHSTLVRLGDLSRYRETELKKKDRNWGPAIGYYELAIVVKPQSGTSHNQLAVIALADNSHVRAVYHLYRALTVDEPFPTAKANLELEFKKILDAWKRGDLLPNGRTGQSAEAMRAWFVCLHAHYYKDIEHAEYDELETEFLRHLAVELKERSLDNLLQKICLINIAAEYLAGRQEKFQAFDSLSSLNVKTFSRLLQILLSELESYNADNDHLERQSSTERLTATTRRILPALRQYSSWLLSNSDLLIAQQKKSLINVEIKEFWKIYTDSLTLLATTFPNQDSPAVDYLLDEDEDTIAFEPLFNQATGTRYYRSGSTQLKARVGANVERHHPNQEMLSRIRDFIEDGRILTKNNSQSLSHAVPIIQVGDRFIYCEEGLPPQLTLPDGVSSAHRHHTSATSISRDDIELARQSGRAPGSGIVVEDAASQSASMSANTDMRQMVDQLVSSDASEDAEPITSVFWAHTGSLQDTHSYPLAVQGIGETNTNWTFPTTPRMASPGHTHHARAPSMEREETLRPTLPSVWNTPFAPLPGESSSPQTRPSTAKAVDATTPSALISSGTFQADLARQQHLIQMQSSFVQTPDPPTSWPVASCLGIENNASSQHHVDSSRVQSSESFSPFSVSLPRPNHSHGPARFGAIGETPPSAQTG
ncbi:MAG: hypothetical protein Q9227_007353 [Pyrenula ochraceoflavens]